jgi:tetratricopeptide (TPR) repeat protein
MSEWNDAEHHAEKAQRYYRSGQWERALAELRTALDKRPDHGEWLFGLGLTLDALERYDEAAEAFARAVEARGEDVNGLLHLGVDLIRAGRPERAIQTLARANELDPDEELGYVHRILAYTILEDHSQAEVMFYLARQHAGTGAAAEEDDDNPPTHGGDPQVQAIAYEYLAQSLLMREDYQRAIWCWQETLRLDPAHPEANRNLAVLYYQLDRPDRARLHFQRQLRLRPSDIATLLEFGEMLLQTNQLAEAGDKFRRVLEEDGTVASAHQRLAEIAVINGHSGAAADRFERARQLDPGLPGVHLGLAQLAFDKGQHERARQWLRQELEIEGQSAEQVLQLASLLVEVGLPHETVRLLTPLLAGGENELLMNDDELHATALLCRGVAYIAGGEDEPGVRDCRRCLQLLPENVTAMLQLATAAERRRDWAEALQWAERGLGHEPDHAGLRRLRKRARRARRRAAVGRWLGRG